MEDKHKQADENNRAWVPFKQGRTIGTHGSEEGVILRDEVYKGGTRITLERDARQIPFAITCGISDWMVHTTYCGTIMEAERKYEEMKLELARIYDFIPYETDPDGEEKLPQLYVELDHFTRKFQ